MSKLLETLSASVPVDAEVFVIDIQPDRSLPIFDACHSAAQRHALVLNRLTAKICAETERTTFVSPPAPLLAPGAKNRHPTSVHYDLWAKGLAVPIVALLGTSPSRPSGRRKDLNSLPAPATERARQRAVDQLDLKAAAADSQLQRIVSLAQRAFNTESAFITVIDKDRQWNLTRAGKSLQEVDRSDSFCDFTIRSEEVMIVRDAQADERFKNNPLVTGESQIRFYAGYPIEAPTGERIGALCVVDSQPRPRAADIDVSLLRELTHLVQRDLERHTPGTDRA